MYGVPSLFTRLLQSKETRGRGRWTSLERVWRMGGRQRDSPRPPSCSTAKTRRRLSMACFRRGNHCNSTGVIPGVLQVPSCAQAAQPAGPCPAGRGPETHPAGGGPGRGTQVEGADPSNVSLETAFPRHLMPLDLAAEVPQFSLSIQCSWRRVYPLKDSSGLAERGTHTHTHTQLALLMFLLLQLGT